MEIKNFRFDKEDSAVLLRKIVANINKRFAELDKNDTSCGHRKNYVKMFEEDMGLYLSGIAREIPSKYKCDFERELVEFKKLEDPEYKEYLRLQKKFEGVK